MTCKTCRRLLSRYHDGVLESATQLRVREHLATCSACAQHLHAIKTLDSRLALAMRPGSTGDFQHRVLAAAVDRWYTAPPLPERRPLRQVGLGSLAGACLAALAILAISLCGLLPSTSQATGLQAGPGAAYRATPRAHPVTPIQAHPTTAPPAPAHPAARPRVGTAANRVAPVTTLQDHAALVTLTAGPRLTTDQVHSPLWSHDSRSLLYLTDFHVDPQSGWYVGTLLRYTSAGTTRIAARVRNFAWSDDDQRIVYAVQAPPGAAEPQILHVVDANGRHDHALGGVDRASLQWLKGQVIAVRHGVISHIDPVSGECALLTQLPPIQVDDEASAFYAVAAGGRYVAYQDISGLRIWDRAAGGALILRQPLARYGVASFHFSWDGATVFYSVFDGRYTMLYRQQLDPLGVATALNNGRPLHGPINLVGPPSANSAIVNFRIGSGANARNYVIDARFGPPHLLLPPGGVGLVGWWSPDGTRLVYIICQDGAALYSAVAGVTLVHT